VPDQPNPRRDPEVRRNKHIARRLLAAFTWGDTAAIREFISPDIKNRSPHPPDAIREEDEIEIQQRSFADLYYREDLIVAEGDMVFIGWEGEGTSTGPLFGKQPTGRSFVANGGEILRFDNGQVVEHWDQFTKPRLEGMVKLGLLDDEMLAEFARHDLI
jgi:predicted ester cyclase